MRQEKRALARYVNAATDLAEQVKYDIQHGDCKISNDTVLKLNEFSIAANAISAIIDEVKKKAIPYDN
jgi:hypothetical protein